MTKCLQYVLAQTPVAESPKRPVIFIKQCARLARTLPTVEGAEFLRDALCLLGTSDATQLLRQAADDLEHTDQLLAFIGR